MSGLTGPIVLCEPLPSEDPQVFEQSPTFAKAGALLGVAVNAQNALQAINPSLLEQFDSVAVRSGKSFAYNHTGTFAVVGSLQTHCTRPNPQ